MKALKFLLIILTLNTTMIAQDSNYNGPAKMHVTNATKQINEASTNIQKKLYTNAENKLEMAEKSITQIKAKDASYNTATMEAEIKKLKASMEATINEEKNGIEAKKEKSKEMVKLKNDIHDYFDEPIYSTKILSLAQKQLDEYKTKVQSIVDRKDLLEDFKKDNDYPSLISRLKGYSDLSLNMAINDIVIACENSDGVKGSNWENAFYDMRGLKAHWDGISQSFSEVKEFADAAKKCGELCAKYPTLQKIEAIGKGNKTAAIKARKLPSPTVKDTKLEQILIVGFDKKYGPAYRAKAVKAVLTQDGWTTERNVITGIVTGRNRTGKIAYKTTEGDGKCYLLSNNIFIYEEYIGGSFTNSQVIYNGLGGEEMLCENIK
jgi:hypothetical protein